MGNNLVLMPNLKLAYVERVNSEGRYVKVGYRSYLPAICQ